MMFETRTRFKKKPPFGVAFLLVLSISEESRLHSCSRCLLCYLVNPIGLGQLRLDRRLTRLENGGHRCRPLPAVTELINPRRLPNEVYRLHTGRVCIHVDPGCVDPGSIRANRSAHTDSSGHHFSADPLSPGSRSKFGRAAAIRF